MRRFMPVLPLLILVACDGGLPPPSSPTSQLQVGFPPHGIADTIVVDAIDPLPLRAAELVAPDGKVTPAGYIDVTASPRYATGQWNAANRWPNSLAVGAPPALIAANTPGGAALQSREQLLATVSTADIALPDPVAYRRNWQHYRIRLSFGTPPGAVETRLIAAPQPPPQTPPAS